MRITQMIPIALLPLCQLQAVAVAIDNGTPRAHAGIAVTPRRSTEIDACVSDGLSADVYFNDFNGPWGTTYPEWTCSGYTHSANRAGTVAAGTGSQTVSTVESPNGKQRFLGEFGGSAIVSAPPYDPQHFVRMDETVTLTLRDLRSHTLATVAFDLYILKSWDGNNTNYGPDRWSLSVQDGPALLDT